MDGLSGVIDLVFFNTFYLQKLETYKTRYSLPTFFLSPSKVFVGFEFRDREPLIKHTVNIFFTWVISSSYTNAELLEWKEAWG